MTTKLLVEDMKNILTICLLLIFGFLPTGCAGNSIVQNEKLSAVADDNSRTIETKVKQTGDLQKQIEQIAAKAKGRVGVKAVVLESGESVGLNSDAHFPMQSVYKLPIGMAVLQQVDAGKLTLEQKVRVEKSDFVRQGQYSPIRDKNPNGTESTVRELLRLSISESDGTASDVLLKLIGGAAAAINFLSEIKVSEINIADSEREIGKDWETQYRNWASPNGSVNLLRALFERKNLSEQSQALILKFMTESTRGAKRLKGLLPNEAAVAHKTGTSGARKEITAATNDIGIITLPNKKHLAIAVFVSDSPADETTRERVIAEIAKAVWDKWNK